MANRIEFTPEHSEQDMLQSQAMDRAVEQAYEDHMDMRRNQEDFMWDPQELVPFALAETPLDVDDAMRSAIYVNGLTEDNLPYYTATIFRMFGDNEALKEWAKNWTMEEDRHGRAIERHEERHQIFDLKWIEAKRRAQIRGGEVPQPPNAFEGAIYVTIQEEATRIPHSHVSRELKKAGDSEGARMYGAIAGDEAGHHRYYKKIAMAMKELDPDYFMIGLHNQARNFAMPGTGIEGFEEHAKLISASGIFGPVDLYKILQTLQGEFGIDDLQLHTEEAKRAREAFNKHVSRLEKLARRFEHTRQKYEAGEYDAPLTWQEGRPIYLDKEPS